MSRRVPTWIGKLVEKTDDATTWEVWRVKDYPGYPPAPAREGRITRRSTRS